jgi:hypothetical protein
MSTDEKPCKLTIRQAGRQVAGPSPSASIVFTRWRTLHAFGGQFPNGHKRLKTKLYQRRTHQPTVDRVEWWPEHRRPSPGAGLVLIVWFPDWQVTNPELAQPPPSISSLPIGFHFSHISVYIFIKGLYILATILKSNWFCLHLFDFKFMIFPILFQNEEFTHIPFRGVIVVWV